MYQVYQKLSSITAIVFIPSRKTPDKVYSHYGRFREVGGIPYGDVIPLLD
jgi:hypothetical protein